MDERYQAYEMFKSIVRQGQYSNLAAKELLQGSKEDKRLVHATVMGALDKLIYLDYVIRAYAKGRIRPFGRISAAFYGYSFLRGMLRMDRPCREIG